VLTVQQRKNAVMTARRPGPLVRWCLRAPARLYDWNAGWLLGRRFLLLTHTGRRTGQRHRTMLEVIGTRPTAGEFLVLAALGRSANWYRNLQAHGAVEVAVGRQRFRPEHRTLSQGEAIAALRDYERRNRLAAPVVRRVLSWLVGWRYDGSDEARRHLARELPVVAFRPTEHPNTTPPQT
jgi:deazaflavin-dependent oxidoreductase (nitroreductase family)